MRPLILPLLMAAALPAFAQTGNPGAHFIENWDNDGDGQVTLEEARAKRSDVFYMFDQDEDGMLTADEYALFDETRAADMEANGGDAKGAMNRISEGMSLPFNDANGDGAVSADEFDAATERWLSLADRNADGVISGGDFGPAKE